MKLDRVEISMKEGRSDVLFTYIYEDNTRDWVWYGFWTACWKSICLIMQGVEIVDCIDR